VRRPRSITAGVVTALMLFVLVVSACGGTSGPRREAATTVPPPPTTTTTEAPLSAGHQVSFYVPRVGDCYDKRTQGAPPSTVVIYLLLPCALPHQNEVYATLDYPDPNFPDTGALEQFAKSQCVASFAAYVGIGYETSSLDLAYQLPDQATWGNGIRHVIGCLVVSADGQRRSGSVRGTGI
jgi:hypothetical protein